MRAESIQLGGKSRRYRRNYRAMIAAGVLCVVSLMGTDARSNEEVVTYATPEFLTAPATVQAQPGTTFTVAKTPPVVDVYLFRDLPIDNKRTLWSNWGDGALTSDGKYFTSIGNHSDFSLGLGQSRVYEYDPQKRKVRQVVNVRDFVPDPKAPAGKIHARIEKARDGALYITSYRGTVPKEEDGRVGGSTLLRYDPATGQTEVLGVPVAGQSLPASMYDPERNLLYWYSVPDHNLVVYDPAKREVRFRGGGDIQSGDRAIMLDRSGNVFFSTQDGSLAKYDPRSNAVQKTSAKLPQPVEAGKPVQTLRAATRATREGIIYGVTGGEARLFSFDPTTEMIKDLGPNFDGAGKHSTYTAVIALSPDEKYLYYTPGAHGSGGRFGVPVVQFNIATGARKVLAFLAEPIRRRLGYRLGGTYNLQVSDDGSRLFFTFNGAPIKEGGKEEYFGQPSIVVVHIPQEER